jgi:cell division protein FtsN
VVLPGFGAFLAEREGAWIHPVTQRFYPPRKRIAFNAQLVLNDGLLQTSLVIEEGLNRDKALEKIQAFVQEIVSDLQRNRNFSFPGIGRFYFNPSDQLEFEPISDTNLLEESFGLTEVFFKPLDSNSTMSQRPVRPVVRRPNANTGTNNTNDSTQKESTKEESKPSSGGAGKLVLILIPLFLLVAAGGTLFYLKQNGRSLASLNPFDSESKKEIKTDTALVADSIALQDSLKAEAALQDTNTAPVDEFSNEITTVITTTDNPSKMTLAEKQEALKKNAGKEKDEDKTTGVVQHGRYFVVVGSFIDKDNAIRLRNKIASRGMNVTLIEKTKDSRFWKVAIDDFANQEEANRRKQELQKEFGDQVWVMSY